MSTELLRRAAYGTTAPALCLQRGVSGVRARPRGSLHAKDVLGPELLSASSLTDSQRAQARRSAATAVTQLDGTEALGIASQAERLVDQRYQEDGLVSAWRANKVGKGWRRGPGIVLLVEGCAVRIRKSVEARREAGQTCHQR